MTLQECQAPIDRRIVLALIEATPAAWSAAQLEAERAGDGDDEQLAAVIRSPDGLTEVVAATPEIFDALLELADCFRSFGKPWTALKYSAWEGEGGAWQFRADYRYD